MTSDSRLRAQRKYDSTHCTVIAMKLNNKYDRDILDKLKSVSSKQGYLKELIIRDIESGTLSETKSDSIIEETAEEKTAVSGVDEPKDISDAINSEMIDNSMEEVDYTMNVNWNETLDGSVEDTEEDSGCEGVAASVIHYNVSDREAFRRNLSELMRVTKVKQVDLAKHIDVSYQTVSAWITGRGYPRTDAMERICQFFGVKQSALIDNPDDEGTEEDALLAAFRVLSKKGKEKLIERAEELMKLHPKKKDIYKD